MDIGQFIHDRRVQLHLTLEEVANIVGVNKSTVKKWESGDISNMRRDKIALLAKALHISPVDLIVDDPDALSSSEDDKLQEYLEELKNRSEMRMLFKLAKNATKEDVEKAVKIIEALTNQET